MTTFELTAFFLAAAMALWMNMRRQNLWHMLIGLTVSPPAAFTITVLLGSCLMPDQLKSSLSGMDQTSESLFISCLLGAVCGICAALLLFKRNSQSTKQTAPKVRRKFKIL